MDECHLDEIPFSKLIFTATLLICNAQNFLLQVFDIGVVA